MAKKIKSNVELMKNGEYFNASDIELIKLRKIATKMCFDINRVNPYDTKKITKLEEKLFVHHGADLFIQPPLCVDYGFNVYIGYNFHALANLTCYDSAPISIGNNVKFGPNVSIYTTNYAIQAKKRNKDLEKGIAVSIGNDVWVGGNVTILPGSVIENGSVIGAGSVVSGHVKANSIYKGNPAVFIADIDQNEK